jgi:hypothetical protein
MSKDMKFVNFIIVMVIAGTTVYSQSFRPLSLSWQSAGSFQSTGDDESLTKTGSVLKHMNVLSLSAKAPLYRDTTSFTLITQLDYSHTDLSDNYSFHTACAALVLYKLLGRNYDMFAMYQPRFSAGRQTGLTVSAYTYNLAAGFGRQFSNSFYGAMGVYYIHSFGQGLTFPLVTLKWSINPKAALIVEFPDQISVAFELKKGLKASLYNRYEANQFRLNNEGKNPEFYRYISTTLGLNISYNLLDNLWADISAGYYLGNKANMFTQNELITTTNFRKATMIKISAAYEISN